METKTQQAEEKLKGCGREFEVYIPNKGIHRVRCGSNPQNKDFHLCPKCLEAVQTMLSCFKEEKEFLEVLKNWMERGLITVDTEDCGINKELNDLSSAIKVLEGEKD